MKSAAISSEGKYYELKLRLDEYVQSENMRRSEVRDMLLRMMCELDQPFSAGELVEMAKTERVSQASVYNIIRLFLKARILQIVSRESTREHARYELLIGKSSMIELKCIRCGRQQRITSKPIINAIMAYRVNNFDTRRFSLFLYGECKVCRSYKRLY